MSKNGFAAPATREALQTVSDAWGIAVQAVKDGAAHAKASADEGFPAAGRFLSRMVYTMSYSFSYGTVFPVAFVAKSIPANNPIVTGMIDGARAANDWVDELKQREPVTQTQPAAKRGRPRGKAKTAATKRKSAG
jgi:hypothetical protein